MNLITCKEDCHYQREGYCKLCSAAPVNAVKVNGCSYYRKKNLNSNRTQTAVRNNKMSINQFE